MNERRRPMRKSLYRRKKGKRDRGRESGREW
jgi:hypothetical protein